MDKETLRMQLLSGVITESEYKTKLEEDKSMDFSARDQKDWSEKKSRMYDSWANSSNELKDLEDDLKKAKGRDDKEEIKRLNNRIAQKKIAIKTSKEEFKKLNESLNENFVGIPAINNIFDREKTDYELAFEHFTKGTSLNEEVEEELEEGNDDLFTAKRFYKRTDNPRINILSHMNAINEIMMDMLETDIVKGYGPDERDFIYQEYMKFANAVKNLVK